MQRVHSRCIHGPDLVLLPDGPQRKWPDRGAGFTPDFGRFRLLDRVGLKHMADKRADELSGGQRQRVGICRALIQDPDVLLVDEPTASLDPKTSRQIMRLIQELCFERGLTAIINIHDVFLAQMFSQRVVGLELGNVVYDGPPDGLTPGVLTRIYGEEDWSATIKAAEGADDDSEDEEF